MSDDTTFLVLYTGYHMSTSKRAIDSILKVLVVFSALVFIGSVFVSPDDNGLTFIAALVALVMYVFPVIFILAIIAGISQAVHGRQSIAPQSSSKLGTIINWVKIGILAFLVFVLLSIIVVNIF